MPFIKRELIMIKQIPVLLTLLFLYSCDTTVSKSGSQEETLHPKLEDSTFLVGLPSTIENAPISALKREFSAYIDSCDLPITAERCRNGTFTAYSPYNSYGYRYEATITVSKSTINTIEYDEVHEDGHSKEKDSLYNADMHGQSKPMYSYPFYRKQLMEKQNLMEIEAVSGATYSLYRFKYSVTKALLKGHEL